MAEGGPGRRHLLERLATAGRPVSDLMTGLDISQAAVSQHLRVLREAGLVTARKEGRHRYCQLRSTGSASGPSPRPVSMILSGARCSSPTRRSG